MNCLDDGGGGSDASLQRRQAADADTAVDVHLVVKDLGLAGLGLGDEGVVEDIKDVLADLLKLGFDLLAVLADSADVLVRALRLLLLLDRRDYAPRRTAGTDDVLVGDGQKVALIHGKLTTELRKLLR